MTYGNLDAAIFSNIYCIITKIISCHHYPSHLMNRAMSTDCDCWKCNIWYGFACCSEGSHGRVSLPVIVGLHDRKTLLLPFGCGLSTAYCSFNSLLLPLMFPMHNSSSEMACKKITHPNWPMYPDASCSDDHDKPEDPWDCQVSSDLKNVLYTNK